MDHLKKYESFININEKLLKKQSKPIYNGMYDININNIPSELWTTEMVENNGKKLDNINISNNEFIDFDDDEFINDDDMVYSPMNKLIENNSDKNIKFSELEDYEIKDVFDEEEYENID